MVLSSMRKVKLGKYQHSKKGTFYRVLAIAKHSETLEDLVVYECLYDNPRSKVWVRPLAMFAEKVVINGKNVPRFCYVGEEE
jgi:hypothetical protein